FSVTWSNVSAGSYSLTAVATDNRGAVNSSGPVNVTINRVQPAVLLSSPVVGENIFVFSFVTQAEWTYTVQASDSLTSTNWTTITNFVGTGGTVHITNGTSGAPQKYFRV